MKDLVNTFINDMSYVMGIDIPHLKDEDMKQFTDIFKEIQVKKGTTFIHEGSIFTHLYFVKKGMMRLYYIKDGIEVSDFFAFENYAFTALESYLCRNVSHLIVEALEDSVLYGVAKEDIEELCRINENINLFYRKKLECIIVGTHRRLRSIRFETANVRYQNLLMQCPTIFQRVPSKYIASYLGVTPETLSRIRSKI